MGLRQLLHGLGLGMLAWSCATAQDCKIPWQTDLATAQQQAAAENKILLIHFWGTYCRPCVNLDHFVFTNSLVGSVVERDFVPVKIDVEKHPEIAKEFGIKTIPHDVMLTPSGQLITKRASPNNSDGYLHMIQGVADSFQRMHPGTLNASAQLAARMPVEPEEKAYIPAGQESIRREPLTLLNVADRSGEAEVASGSFTPNAFTPTFQTPAVQTPAAPTAAGVTPIPTAPIATRIEPAAAGSGMARQVAARNEILTPPTSSGGFGLLQPRPEPVTPAAVTPAASRGMARVSHSHPAPIGLEGFCPVTLYQTRHRQAGNPQWGCVHRGRLYFFASREAFERFRMTPDVFSPQLAGSDPVTYTRTGQLVAGRLDYHLFHPLESRDVLLLFETEENRTAFLQDPARYLGEVEAAVQYADAPVIRR